MLRCSVVVLVLVLVACTEAQRAAILEGSNGGMPRCKTTFSFAPQLARMAKPRGTDSQALRARCSASEARPDVAVEKVFERVNLSSTQKAMGPGSAEGYIDLLLRSGTAWKRIRVLGVEVLEDRSSGDFDSWSFDVARSGNRVALVPRHGGEAILVDHVAGHSKWWYVPFQKGESAASVLAKLTDVPVDAFETMGAR